MAEFAAPPEPPAEEACSPSLVNRLTDAAKNLKVAAVQGAHNTDHAVQKARAVLGARDEDELLIAGDVIDAGAREAHVRLISGRGLEREGARRRGSRCALRPKRRIHATARSAAVMDFTELCRQCTVYTLSLIHI